MFSKGYSWLGVGPSQRKRFSGFKCDHAACFECKPPVVILQQVPDRVSSGAASHQQAKVSSVFSVSPVALPHVVLKVSSEEGVPNARAAIRVQLDLVLCSAAVGWQGTTRLQGQKLGSKDSGLRAAVVRQQHMVTYVTYDM